MIQITVAGRTGKDAVLRKTQSDKSVLGFSVAVDVGWGQSKHTLWVDCSIWGDRANKLAPYLTKGTPVTVVGEADLREWLTQDGSPKTSLTCNVREIALQGKGAEQEQEPAPKPEPAAADYDIEDDIPF